MTNPSTRPPAPPHPPAAGDSKLSPAFSPTPRAASGSTPRVALGAPTSQAAGLIARPTKAQIAAAANHTIPDLVGEGLVVLFSGINPSLYSAATGHHFARPGNRFWPALFRSGFTPRQLHPSEQPILPSLGLGITNVVARATARADELSPAELVAGGEHLAALTARWRPRFLAVLGVTAYRTAFARPKAVVGPQSETIGDARVWVLPNPSGLNAAWTMPRLAVAFNELREAAEL